MLSSRSLARRRSRAAAATSGARVAAQGRSDRDRRCVAEADAGDRRQPVLVLRARVPRVRDAALFDRACSKSNGFNVETGVSGMPSSWWATWGSGEPVIALGSDVDGIPKASQLPGVAYREPMIDGAPGHGEGHNSGQAVNIVAALAVKQIMQRERLPGTIVLWPGVAEELLAAKAWFVRDGRFDGVDAVLFTHVGSRFEHRLGPNRRHGARVRRVLVRRHGGAQRRHAVARPQRARRRRAHEHRLELSPRALESDAALALRHRRRRRSAERRAARGDGLVLRARESMRPASARTSTRCSESPKARR